MSAATATASAGDHRRLAGKVSNRAVVALVIVIPSALMFLLEAPGLFLPYAQAMPLAGALAAADMLIVGVVYWWLLTKVPYFAPVARSPRWLAFVWGAGAAPFIISALETTFGAPWGADSSTAANVITGSLSGPIEESIKALGVLVVFLFVQRPRTLVEGLVIGASAGLGCQVVEDGQYVLTQSFEGGNAGSAVVMTVIRLVGSVSSHWAFSGILGVGLAYVFCAKWATPARRAGVLVACAALAIVLHSGFDMGMALMPNSLGQIAYNALIVVQLLPGVVAILLVMRWARNREGELYVTYLVRDGASGLPEAQLHALPHGVTRRRARVQAADGAATKDATKAVHHAVRALHRAGARLADALAEASPESVEAARTAVATQVAAAVETGAELDGRMAQAATGTS